MDKTILKGNLESKSLVYWDSSLGRKGWKLKFDILWMLSLAIQQYYKNYNISVRIEKFWEELESLKMWSMQAQGGK